MLKFHDARALSADDAIEADVCVVGAGIAGLTFAAGLAGTGLRIALLESGGRGERAPLELARGTTDLRLLYRPDDPYLEQSRLRTYGGTAADWRRECGSPPDLELQARPWIAESGWPLSSSELGPFRLRAQQLLGVDGDEASPPRTSWWGESFHAAPLRLAAEGSVTGRLESAFAGTSSVEVWTHANVTDVDVDPVDGRVANLTVQVLDGPAFRARARRFVLAAGAIENARLLLASRAAASSGLGNEHDLVGRFFMDQILCRVGTLLVPGAGASLAAFQPTTHSSERFAVRYVLRPSDRSQRRHELLGSLLRFDPLAPDEEPALRDEVAHLVATASGSGADEPHFHAAVAITVEPRPSRDNRVALAADADRLGLPRVELSWTDHEYENWTLRTTSHLLAESAGSALAGRLYMPRIRDLPRHARPLGHQAGTTRMGRRPEDGVVDLDCRVHSVANLYVAGSSVFPTLGSHPPIVTAMALALRLAEHFEAPSRRL